MGSSLGKNRVPELVPEQTVLQVTRASEGPFSSSSADGPDSPGLLSLDTTLRHSDFAMFSINGGRLEEGMGGGCEWAPRRLLKIDNYRFVSIFHAAVPPGSENMLHISDHPRRDQTKVIQSLLFFLSG